MTWSVPSTRGMSNIKTFLIGHKSNGCRMWHEIFTCEARRADQGLWHQCGKCGWPRLDGLPSCGRLINGGCDQHRRGDNVVLTGPGWWPLSVVCLSINGWQMEREPGLPSWLGGENFDLRGQETGDEEEWLSQVDRETSLPGG